MYFHDFAAFKNVIAIYLHVFAPPKNDLTSFFVGKVIY